MKPWNICLALTLAALAIVPAGAHAQSAYPSKPVRMINPLSAGGGLDIIARKLATKMEGELGQAIVVENKPGASGMIASDLVAKSAADGYTLLVAPGSTMSILPHVMPKLPYSPSDLMPLIQIGTTPFVMLVNGNNPAQRLEQFLAAAKEKPGSLSFGSNGIATLGHLMGEELKRAASVDLVHVAYKGSAPAIADLLGGQISTIMTDFATARSFLQTGNRVRVLALTGAKRNPVFPAVPTFTELGLPTLEPMTGSIVLWAPAGLPPGVAERIVASVDASLRGSDMRQTLNEYGYEPTAISGDRVNDVARQESARWQKIIREMGGLSIASGR